MLWGSAITASGIVLTSMTFVLPADLVPHIFWGRQDNVGLRFGGGLALLFNILICAVALIAIMGTVPAEQPQHEREARPEIPASPTLGS